MTKNEMLGKLKIFRDAVAALPDKAELISVRISNTSEYVHLSTLGDLLPNPEREESVLDGGEPYIEFRTEINGVTVLWVG